MKFSLKTISYFSLLAICWGAGASYASSIGIMLPSSFQLIEAGMWASPGVKYIWSGSSGCSPTMNGCYFITGPYNGNPPLPSGSYVKAYLTVQNQNSVCSVSGLSFSVTSAPSPNAPFDVALVPKSTSGSLEPSSTCPYKSYSIQFSGGQPDYNYTATFSFK